MKRTLLILVSILSVWGSAAADRGVFRGRVTADGAGVADVTVTDGYNFTRTDRSGRYTLAADSRARFVHISSPSGYSVPSKGSVPQFYLPVERQRDTYDFVLRRNPHDDRNHTFVVTADIQVTSRGEVADFRAIADDIATTAAAAGGDCFGLDCGDIVGDSGWLYPDYLKAADRLGIPVYRAIGNHDMDYYGPYHETSYSTFERYFGPVCYSFNKGGVHYIVLDNCFYVGRDYFYFGYYDRTTIDWIRGDLGYVPKGTLLIIVQHIPSRLTSDKQPFEYSYGVLADQTVNAEALYALTEGYRTHIISGHMHANSNIVHSDGLFEHNTGAVCGTWWKGDICIDGTPRGYGVYTVRDGRLSWYYKSASYPKEHQVRAYAAGSYDPMPDAVVANVWNWDPEWRVELFENGIKTADMERFSGYDHAARMLCSDRAKVVYDWISPAPTDHLFSAVPRDRNAALEVRVTDRFGRLYSATPR